MKLGIHTVFMTNVICDHCFKGYVVCLMRKYFVSKLFVWEGYIMQDSDMLSKKKSKLLISVAFQRFSWCAQTKTSEYSAFYVLFLYFWFQDLILLLHIATEAKIECCIKNKIECKAILRLLILFPKMFHHTCIGYLKKQRNKEKFNFSLFGWQTWLDSAEVDSRKQC